MMLDHWIHNPAHPCNERKLQQNCTLLKPITRLPVPSLILATRTYFSDLKMGGGGSANNILNHPSP